MPQTLLSLDTSTDICSAALHTENGLLGYQEFRKEKSHAALLPPAIEALLSPLQLRPSSLSAIAISAGPGSYTGLRIGLSIAKGLCFALDLPLIAVNTLEAMAVQARQSLSSMLTEKDLLIPMLDARRMEVYHAIYGVQHQHHTAPAPLVVEENSFGALQQNHRLILFGNGAAKCRGVLPQKNMVFVEGIYPSAKQVGSIGWQKLQAQDFEDTAYFEPQYLKAFQGTKPSKNSPLAKSKR